MLTYDELARELFAEGPIFWLDANAHIQCGSCDAIIEEDINNASSKMQLIRLFALNQLLNIAEYYNRLHPTSTSEKAGIIYVRKEGYHAGYFIGNSMGYSVEFNNIDDVKAVIANPNFRKILNLVYRGDEGEIGKEDIEE